MKNNFLNILSVAALALVLLPACDKGLEELNKNPDAYTEVIPEYLFTKAQLDAVNNNYFGSAALTIGGSMQQFATYKEVPAAGDKYFNEGYSYSHFTTAYPNEVNEIQEVIRAVAEKPEEVNKLAIARIWRVFIMHRLTDLYGDIPYTEAGQGLTNKNFTPKYDEQSSVYPDMLKELEEAAQALNPALPSMGNSDLIYGGDPAKWKRFAYSLMLRLGMRLTKVDATTAKTWVEKAIAGGVITNESDIALIEYVDGSQVNSRNPIAQALLTGDYINPQSEDNVEGGKLAKTFIDHLKNTADPRLNVIAVVWVKNANGTYVADTTSALQQGMPNAAFNSRPANFNTFSEPHPNTILRYDAPLIVLSSAEVNLLLAEAALRGWYAGNPSELYTTAVGAGMRNWAYFGAAGVISSEKINAYLTQNPYPVGDSFEQQIEAIQTEKWVSLFLDEYEIYANWRRTGYPQLIPTNYPGNLTGGTIPRRFVLPPSEENINATNFYEVINRQGPNRLTSRVWWDN